jgi:probable DNA metabolism protein
MMQLVYDGTFEGLLCGIFAVYERKLDDVQLVTGTHRQLLFHAGYLDIATDSPQAMRVWDGLRKKISTDALNNIYQTFLSELPEREAVILSFIRHALASRENIEKDFGHPAVLSVAQIARRVHREKHRMEAFVRFQRTRDNVYWSLIEPDFNVLPLLVSHFKDRYADQAWIIYDRTRGYGIEYSPQTEQVQSVTLELAADVSKEFLPDAICHEEETAYQALWKNYFRSVDIESRKNMKLHVRHVPTRYWKFLTEKR